MNKKSLLPFACCLLPLLALSAFALPRADAQTKPAGWVADASKAPLPTTKAAGVLNGSPLTVKKATWRRKMSLDFSDAPLDMMVLELDATTKKPHGLGMPMDIDLKELPPEARAEFLKSMKKVNPNAITFVVTVAVRKGASVAGKEFRHGPKDGIGSPEAATPEKPVLVGMEARLSETDTVSIGYTMRLKFGPRRGAVQPGAIYLCLEDADKSRLVGTFEAVVK